MHLKLFILAAIYPAAIYTTAVQTIPVDNDTNNTTVSLLSRFYNLLLDMCFALRIRQLQVFIGGLDSNVTEEELRQVFLQFGDIVYVKIPASKGCGFVQFSAR